MKTMDVHPKMPTVLPVKTYASLSWADHLAIRLKRLLIPVVTIQTALTWPFHRHTWRKSWKRLFGDAQVQFLTKYFTWNQLQYVFGTTFEAYSAWAKEAQVTPVVDELDGNARLLWIGPKRTDRVLLYCPGGGFLHPPAPGAIRFWNYVQEQLAARDAPVGIALLSYSPVTDVVFPTQLAQAVQAIRLLLDSGVEPGNIQLAGDSAGGNLVLQILSHMLHPHPSVPSLALPAGSRFGAIYLMSVWVDLIAKNVPSFEENSSKDIISGKSLRTWGKITLADVPPSEMNYIHTLQAPDDWLKGVDKLVRKVLITVGGDECMRDSGKLMFEKHFRTNHPDVEFIVQQGGVHDDPYFDFMLTLKPKMGELTPLIVNWVGSGFA